MLNYDKNEEKELPKPSIEIIRSGMTNFIGQAIALMPFDGNDRNALVVAMLLEEVLKVAQIDKDKPCDLKILTSLFKSVKVVLEQHIQELSKNPTKENKELILDYLDIVDAVSKKFLNGSKTV